MKQIIAEILCVAAIVAVLLHLTGCAALVGPTRTVTVDDSGTPIVCTDWEPCTNEACKNDPCVYLEDAATPMIDAGPIQGPGFHLLPVVDDSSVSDSPEAGATCQIADGGEGTWLLLHPGAWSCTYLPR
jgi:hypothetical protein